MHDKILFMMATQRMSVLIAFMSDLQCACSNVILYYLSIFASIREVKNMIFCAPPDSSILKDACAICISLIHILNI